MVRVAAILDDDQQAQHLAAFRRYADELKGMISIIDLHTDELCVLSHATKAIVLQDKTKRRRQVR
jgi:hypothetical protein